MSRSQGFTLLEVLIALAIFAIGILGVLRGTSVVTEGVGHLRIRIVAGWIANNRVAEIRASGLFPSIGANEGSLAMAGNQYYWREEIRPTPNPLFRRVDVRVYASPEDRVPIAQVAGFAVEPLR